MNFIPFPNLVTKRLRLRQVTLEDTAEIFVFRSDEDILKYIANPPLQTLKEASEWIKEYGSFEENKFINWGITTKDSNTLIGNICIWNINTKNLRGEVGYSLHPDFQGNGYMNEAIQTIINYGFDELKLHSLEAHINPENLGSIKAVTRNGFVKEAHLKENQCLNGIFYDTAIYSLINKK